MDDLMLLSLFLPLAGLLGGSCTTPVAVVVVGCLAKKGKIVVVAVLLLLPLVLVLVVVVGRTQPLVRRLRLRHRRRWRFKTWFAHAHPPTTRALPRYGSCRQRRLVDIPCFRVAGEVMRQAATQHTPFRLCKAGVAILFAAGAAVEFLALATTLMAGQSFATHARFAAVGAQPIGVFVLDLFPLWLERHRNIAYAADDVATLAHARSIDVGTHHQLSRMIADVTRELGVCLARALYDEDAFVLCLVVSRASRRRSITRTLPLLPQRPEHCRVVPGLDLSVHGGDQRASVFGEGGVELMFSYAEWSEGGYECVELVLGVDDGPLDGFLRHVRRTLAALRRFRNPYAVPLLTQDVVHSHVSVFAQRSSACRADTISESCEFLIEVVSRCHVGLLQRVEVPPFLLVLLVDLVRPRHRGRVRHLVFVLGFLCALLCRLCRGDDLRPRAPTEPRRRLRLGLWCGRRVLCLGRGDSVVHLGRCIIHRRTSVVGSVAVSDVHLHRVRCVCSRTVRLVVGLVLLLDVCVGGPCLLRRPLVLDSRKQRQLIAISSGFVVGRHGSGVFGTLEGRETFQRVERGVDVRSRSATLHDEFPQQDEYLHTEFQRHFSPWRAECLRDTLQVSHFGFHSVVGLGLGLGLDLSVGGGRCRHLIALSTDGGLWLEGTSECDGALGRRRDTSLNSHRLHSAVRRGRQGSFDDHGLNGVVGRCRYRSLHWS
mmetsp:Transcript_70240/g.165311  ORF Transcript_70240/g.165311 Transcript_70240/m.165311 type:complete len:711 (+) Transcript_70240:407-2539(+)